MSLYVTQYGHTLTLRQGWDDVYPKPEVSKESTSVHYICMAVAVMLDNSK